MEYILDRGFKWICSHSPTSRNKKDDKLASIFPGCKRGAWLYTALSADTPTAFGGWGWGGTTTTTTIFKLQFVYFIFFNHSNLLGVINTLLYGVMNLDAIFIFSSRGLWRRRMLHPLINLTVTFYTTAGLANFSGLCVLRSFICAVWVCTRMCMHGSWTNNRNCHLNQVV